MSDDLILKVNGTPKPEAEPVYLGKAPEGQAAAAVMAETPAEAPVAEAPVAETSAEAPAAEGYVAAEAVESAPEEPKKKRKKLTPKQITDIIVTIVLVLGSVVMLLPFVWMVFATLKPHTEVYTTFFPRTWTLAAYSDMWDDCEFVMKGSILRGILNSLVATVPVVAVQILVSAFAAYAFAKLRFVGKNVIFLVLLGTMMIPFAVVMLPQAWLYGRLNLINGPLAVIIPKFFGSITTVFFLRQFFYGIPDSITEAARLDGAGYTRTFLSVLLPLVMPAIATQAILSFIGNWNDFLGPLLYIEDKEWWTLPVLLQKGLGAGGSGTSKIPSVLAASLISLVPIIVVFAVFQKKIIGSIVFSAVKG